jgi:hypothetical protein
MFEAKPWIRRIGFPSPSTAKAIFTPSEEKKTMPSLPDDAASIVGNRVAKVKHAVRTFGFTVMKMVDSLMY